ncbi:universal stress protein [Actinoallomurus acanthiterrae]
MPRRSIVVGIDGSAPSEAALEWAVHEASLRGVGLCLIHVFPSAPSVLSEPGRAQSWEDTQRLADERHRNAEKIAPGVHVRSEVIADGAAATLIERSTDAGLVVLGKRGRGGFRGLLAGSVALQVAGHADCPVVIVHAGWRPPIDDREIVVGVGGDTALREAFAEAELRGVRLRAVRAWQPLVAAGPTGMVPMGTTIAEVERNEQSRLAQALQPWREEYPRVRVVESIVCDRARHALIEAAGNAELLVIGARERWGTHALALGTTAHAVVHHVDCPILIARDRPQPSA